MPKMNLNAESSAGISPADDDQEHPDATRWPGQDRRSLPTRRLGSRDMAGPQHAAVLRWLRRPLFGKRPNKAVIDGRDRYLIATGRRRRPPSTASA